MRRAPSVLRHKHNSRPNISIQDPTKPVKPLRKSDNKTCKPLQASQNPTGRLKPYITLGKPLKNSETETLHFKLWIYKNEAPAQKLQKPQKDGSFSRAARSSRASENSPSSIPSPRVYGLGFRGLGFRVYDFRSIRLYESYY